MDSTSLWDRLTLTALRLLWIDKKINPRGEKSGRMVGPSHVGFSRILCLGEVVEDFVEILQVPWVSGPSVLV